jgi:dolichyl-phosphate beta-glucosyltransferase
MRGLDFNQPATQNNGYANNHDSWPWAFFESIGHVIELNLQAMTNQAPRVSIVIPAKNEAVRLPPSIRQIRNTFPDEAWEFIIVIELSTDGTEQRVREAIGGDSRFVVIANPVARGKGYAVKTGMLQARGDLIFFMDADLSVPLGYIPEFLKHAEAADVLVGSRRHSESIIRVHQSFTRELSGRMFNLALRLAGITRLADTQCGFKAFRRDVAQAVFSKLEQDGFGFDVEVLLLASQLGFRSLELPVEWADVKGTKVSFLSGFEALRDAILAARRIKRKYPTHANSRS